MQINPEPQHTIHAMNIDRIITMASRGVRIQFLAFERSLRAVGCDLPLLVIPYGDDPFDLPPNAEWWHMKEFASWLKQSQADPTMWKYVCFTEANYAYFDTDICLIEDFRPALADQTDLSSRIRNWSSTEKPPPKSRLTCLQGKQAYGS